MQVSKVLRAIFTVNSIPNMSTSSPFGGSVTYRTNSTCTANLMVVTTFYGKKRHKVKKMRVSPPYENTTEGSAIFFLSF